MSIIQEPVKLVQEVSNRKIVKLRKFLGNSVREVLCNTTFKVNINSPGYAKQFRNLGLHKSFAVSAPTQTVWDKSNILIAAILHIELLCFQ